MRGKWTEETLLARAKQAEDALLSLTCGGSEFFVADGDAYRVDVPACMAYIRRSREDRHHTLVGAVVEQKAAMARARAMRHALTCVTQSIEWSSMEADVQAVVLAALSLAHTEPSQGE